MKKCNSLLRRLAPGAVSLPQTSVSVRNPFSTNRPGAGPMRARRNPTRAPGPRYPVTGLRFCTARPAATALLHVSDVPEERGEIIPRFNQLDSGALRLNTEACKFNNAGSRWKKSWILIERPESLCKQCRHVYRWRRSAVFAGRAAAFVAACRQILSLTSSNDFNDFLTINHHARLRSGCYNLCCWFIHHRPASSRVIYCLCLSVSAGSSTLLRQPIIVLL